MAPPFARFYHHPIGAVSNRLELRPVSAQKPILHKNLSGLGIGLPMKIATDDF